MVRRTPSIALILMTLPSFRTIALNSFGHTAHISTRTFLCYFPVEVPGIGIEYLTKSACTDSLPLIRRRIRQEED